MSALALITVLATATDVEVDNVIQHVASAVSRSSAVRIETHSVMLQVDTKSGAFVRNDEARISAVFGTSPRSRARADYHPIVAVWHGGSAPFYEESYEFSYDGRYTTLLWNAVGPEGHASPCNKAEIFASADEYEKAYVASGLQATLFGECGNATRLPVFLTEQARIDLSYSTENIGGAQLIRLSTTSKVENGGFNQAWWFDPSHGYALVRIRSEAGGVPIHDLQAEELFDAGGIWFPRQASLSKYNHRGECVSKRTWHILSVEVYTDERPESEWQLDIPAGTKITDSSEQATRTVSSTPAMLDATIERQVLEAKAAAGQHVNARESNGRNQWWWYCGCVVLIGTGSWFMYSWRQRRTGSAGLALMLIASATSFSSAQDGWVGLSRNAKIKLSNCGLNTTLFACRYFDRDVRIEKIQLGLSCGDKWESPASLLAIERLLASENLNVTPFKDAKLSSVVGALDGTRIAIIHLLEPASAGGHYLLLVAHDGNGRVFVVDAGQRTGWYGRDELDEMMRSMSGIWLLIDAIDSESRIWQLPSETVSVRMMAPQGTVGTLVVKSINVSNSLGVPLAIVNAKSSCGCFDHALFRDSGTHIQPGATGILELYFRSGQLRVGEQEVRLRFSGLPDEVTTVVHISIEGVPLSVRARSLPEEINMGTLYVDNDRVFKERVTIVRPIGSGIRGWNADSKAVGEIVLIGTSMESGFSRDEYEVQLELVPDENVDCILKFRLTGSSEPEIAVRLRAEPRRRAAEASLR